MTLIKLMLINKVSKVKLLGEVSKSFRTKMVLRQGNDFSAIIFNLVLDMVMRTFWEDNDCTV